MSYTRIPAESSTPDLIAKTSLVVAALTDLRLTASDKIVYTALVLRFHNTRTRRCFPSLATIMDATRYSEREVRYALRRLGACGYLLVIFHRGRASTYHLKGGSGVPHPPAVECPHNTGREHRKKRFTEEVIEEGVFG